MKRALGASFSEPEIGAASEWCGVGRDRDQALGDLALNAAQTRPGAFELSRAR